MNNEPEQKLSAAERSAMRGIEMANIARFERNFRKLCVRHEVRACFVVAYDEGRNLVALVASGDDGIAPIVNRLLDAEQTKKETVADILKRAQPVITSPIDNGQSTKQS